MERLVKDISFTLSEWKNMKYKKNDLIWVSESQRYVEDIIGTDENMVHTTPCTLCILEEIWINESNAVFGIIVHDIVRGERGSFGIHQMDIIRNFTQDLKKENSALLVQKRYRKYAHHKKRVLWALKVLQPIAREWYVNPYNPSHIVRMREIALRHGMMP